MNDSDPGATLHFPPGTNGSAAPGVPDQSKCPPGFFAVRVEGGIAFICAAFVVGIGPGMIPIANNRAELVLGTSLIYVQHAPPQFVKATPETLAPLVTQAMTTDPKTQALSAHVEATRAQINAINKTEINIQNAEAALDKALEELRSK